MQTRNDSLGLLSPGPHRLDATLRYLPMLVAVVVASWLSFVPAHARAQLLELPALRATQPDTEIGSALRTGAYDQLDSLAEQSGAASALLARAWRAEMQGNWSNARRFVDAAAQRSVAGDVRRASQLARARLIWAEGKRDRAVSMLRSTLSEHPDARAIRFELGRMLIGIGKSAEAEPILDVLARDFNRGAIDSALELALLGRAMDLLGSYQDANQAFSRAIETRSESVYALNHWAELFLSKYNTADAKKTFRDALEVNSNHPASLVGLARVEMETKNYYDRARQLLDRALQSYQAFPPAVVARANISIFDGDWAQARARAEQVLQTRPDFLPARTVVAATHYLQDDSDAFEREVDAILDIRPDYAALFNRTASFANIVHRYPEVVELYRRALKLAPSDGEALLGLGMGQSRLGRLDAALRTLQRAYNADPYNSRAYNMVEFFESELPDYAVFRHDRFLLRTHDSEQAVLNQLVAPLVADSLETYDDKYDFRPAGTLSVEVYPTPQAFGVRTVGVPNISPHGICFGSVVATRSPSEGNFNWRQVVWHEMAHVYHLKRADYRVPRWFTEGLAEFETNVRRDAWVRHHDRSIAHALRHGDIPSIVELNTQFSQAKSYRDILQAYHLSSLVIHFIHQTWGFDAVNEMLDAYPDKLKTDRVLQSVFELDVAAFDQKFRAWLRDKYRRFNNQLLIRPAAFPSISRLRARPESERGAEWHAHYAWRLAERRKTDKAGKAIQQALEQDGDLPTARLVAMLLARQRGELDVAYDHGMKILEQSSDDYALRVVLGDITRQLERPEEALIHLRAATELYPDGARAWQSIRQLADARDRPALRARAVERIFELDQTSASAARQYFELSRSDGRWPRAKRAADRWIAIQPFEAKAHRARAEAAIAVGEGDDAVQSWLALAAIRPDGDATTAVLKEGIRQLRQAGMSSQATTLEQRLNRRNSP